MLKNKSLKELFTELTPQEAAAIEGGYSVEFISLEVKNFGVGGEMVTLTADNKEIFRGEFTRLTPKSIVLNRTDTYPDGSATTIKLAKGLFGNIPIGDFTVSEKDADNDNKTKILEGAFSEYELVYNVSL